MKARHRPIPHRSREYLRKLLRHIKDIAGAMLTLARNRGRSRSDFLGVRQFRSAIVPPNKS
ncbi:hypothetical protein [Kamptonema sp. UHCC 0994]|uniref:hypothetical protein n=1 Tax=Kamptonema sp. UHCC 0994 TaxID=3031329 RepID=UPI0023B922BD|nr:hypothetical protein [Kamptonema sp. UHCC 0994]MDF0552541.1 hypothetical protein [Kamptonema sp. UHCC 0994]